MSEPGIRSPWRVFAATSVGVVAVFINISGLNVALPTITRELGASAGQANWILLSYMLVTTALILVFGRLADILGRRRLYLAGLVVFTVAALLAAISPSAEFLIAARVVQAIGAAAVITNNIALLTDVFPAHSLGRALGWNATVAAVAQVAGPVVGGAATTILGPRGLFLVCLPIGLIAIIASTPVIPRTRPDTTSREPFDVSGALLSAAVLIAAVLAMSPDLSSIAWLPWISSTVAVALFAVFLVVQTRRPHPLIDVRLFRDRAVCLAFAAVLTNGMSNYAVVLLASLHSQAVGSATPLAAGILVTPVAVGTLIAAAVAGSLFGRFTPRTLTSVGMAVTACGLLGFSLTLSPGAVSFWGMAPFLFLVGGGTGLFMTPNTSALMLSVPADRRGIANGLRSTLQNVGYLLSTALALAIATDRLSPQARQGAYDGTLNALRTTELEHFVGNVRTAGFLLATVAIAGLVICLNFPDRHLRATPPIPPASRPEPATT